VTFRSRVRCRTTAPPRQRKKAHHDLKRKGI